MELNLPEKKKFISKIDFHLCMFSSSHFSSLRLHHTTHVNRWKMLELLRPFYLPTTTTRKYAGKCSDVANAARLSWVEWERELGNWIENSLIIMNRRDIKTKNKIGDSDVGNDNELQPLQGFSEGFNSNGINKFGEYFSPIAYISCSSGSGTVAHTQKVQQRNKNNAKSGNLHSSCHGVSVRAHKLYQVAMHDPKQCQRRPWTSS